MYDDDDGDDLERDGLRQVCLLKTRYVSGSLVCSEPVTAPNLWVNDDDGSYDDDIIVLVNREERSKKS